MLAMPGKRIRRADRVAFLAGLAVVVAPHVAIEIGRAHV